MLYFAFPVSSAGIVVLLSDISSALQMPVTADV
jgi:hypothetical protein